LGGTAGVGRAGVFPAKFSFDIFATPSCQNDFVVYTTSSAGASSTGTSGTTTGTFSGIPLANETITVTRTGSPVLTLTASLGSNVAQNFQIDASTTTTATNLANAIARNGGTAGVTATSVGAVVTVTALTAGTTPGVTLTDGLSNFTWAATTLSGGTAGSGQATIVAFNQLYKITCGTTPTQAVPNTFWSYNTGTGAIAETSPVLAKNGSQVAFVQRTANVASLVILKWSSSASVGTVGAPTTLTTQTAANYRNCVAPCMLVIPFNGNPNNTNSSPFYDYDNDMLYVGDDSGRLHKFTGIFLGAPAEQVGGGFPALVSSNNRLSSPVYDSTSGLVFVGSDFNSGLTTAGGRLHSINASGTAVSSTPLARFTTTVDNDITTGVRDAPIVDSTAGRVYVFAESGLTSDCSSAECKSVYQFPVTFAANATWNSRTHIGRGQKWYRTLYGGTFDNTYFTSLSSASPSGNLFVCGSEPTGATSQRPTLWRIPITNNVMGTAEAGPTLVSGDSGDCSPVTEIVNGVNDYIFVSTTQTITDPGRNRPPVMGGCGVAGTCTVFMLNLTGKAWNTSATANATLPASGGTGGIIIDNVSITPGASQIYFSNLGISGNPGNAVQASQAALQ
jgi:hypothetical protein